MSTSLWPLWGKKLDSVSPSIGYALHSTGWGISSETWIGLTDFWYSIICPIIYEQMKIWQNWLGSQATWWIIQIHVNPTTVSEAHSGCIRCNIDKAVHVSLFMYLRHFLSLHSPSCQGPRPPALPSPSLPSASFRSNGESGRSSPAGGLLH